MIGVSILDAHRFKGAQRLKKRSLTLKENGISRALLYYYLSRGLLQQKSTARVSSRKYFIPGCVGRGLDLDLRIRPAAAPPAASGNPGYTDFAPLGFRSKNIVFEWLGS